MRRNFRLFIGAVVVAAGLLSAMPATAATISYARFDDGIRGSANLTVQASAWRSGVRVNGLPPGEYAYRIGLYADVDGNGVPEGGAVRSVCTFEVTGRRGTDGCQGHGRAFLDIWGSPDPPDLVIAQIDLLLPNTGIEVASARFF